MATYMPSSWAIPVEPALSHVGFGQAVDRAVLTQNKKTM
jgi:hypothetical protein